MSLMLEASKVEAKTYPIPLCGGEVWIGNEVLAMEDFCHLVKYVVTNSDIGKDDPRSELVLWMRRLEEVEGFNKGRARLEAEPGIDEPIKAWVDHVLSTVADENKHGLTFEMINGDSKWGPVRDRNRHVILSALNEFNLLRRETKSIES